jgi:hypothetical protein
MDWAPEANQFLYSQNGNQLIVECFLQLMYVFSHVIWVLLLNNNKQKKKTLVIIIVVFWGGLGTEWKINFTSGGREFRSSDECQDYNPTLPCVIHVWIVDICFSFCNEDIRHRSSEKGAGNCKRIGHLNINLASRKLNGWSQHRVKAPKERESSQ